MSAATVLQSIDLPSAKRVGSACGLLWRGLLTTLGCAAGGCVVGVLLGLLVAFPEFLYHLTSWNDAWVHCSRLLAELLADWPL